MLTVFLHQSPEVYLIPQSFEHFREKKQVGSQEPRQAIGCKFPCYRVIFDIGNAKFVVK